MPTSFQPEKPHDTARRSTSFTALMIAVVSALLVMMLVALAVPSEEEGVNWLWTIGSGVAVFLGVLAYGLTRSGNRGTAA